MACCDRSPLTLPLASCTGPTVAMLDLRGFGLRGTLPAALADLTGLRALGLADNPGLTGALPDLSALGRLLWMSVQVCLCLCKGGWGGAAAGACAAPACAPLRARAR